MTYCTALEPTRLRCRWPERITSTRLCANSCMASFASAHNPFVVRCASSLERMVGHDDSDRLLGQIGETALHPSKLIAIDTPALYSERPSGVNASNSHFSVCVKWVEISCDVSLVTRQRREGACEEVVERYIVVSWH